MYAILNLIIFIACAAMYIANIVKIWFVTGIGEAIVRVLGVFFPPLGVILGLV